MVANTIPIALSVKANVHNCGQRKELGSTSGTRSIDIDEDGPADMDCTISGIGSMAKVVQKARSWCPLEALARCNWRRGQPFRRRLF